MILIEAGAPLREYQSIENMEHRTFGLGPAAHTGHGTARGRRCCSAAADGVTGLAVRPSDTWGTAVGMGVSGILACTFAGIVVTNLRHDAVRSTEAYMHSISSVLFVAFFTLAGMKLDFTQVPAAAGLVGLFVYVSIVIY